MPAQQSKKQVGYLLSDDSPLSPEQKKKELAELHSGAVTVEEGPKDVKSAKKALSKKKHPNAY